MSPHYDLPVRTTFQLVNSSGLGGVIRNCLYHLSHMRMKNAASNFNPGAVLRIVRLQRVFDVVNEAMLRQRPEETEL